MKRFWAVFLVLALWLSVPALAVTEEEMDAAVEARCREVLSVCTDGSMTDLEKLTALHDWLALNCEYGATLRGETAYGSLVEGTGNCIGYAEGYAALAAAAGLEGTMTYSGELDHAWILATLEGDRYFSDCTWDDGKYQRMGLIRHSYFLFDEGNARETGHSGWDSGEAVPGGGLELAPWARAVTRVIFHERYAYYIDGAFRLIRCDRSTWETEILTELSDRWPDMDPEDGQGPEVYTGLVFSGGRLYFNTPEDVRSVDLEGSDMRVVFAPDTGGGHIYGIAVENGRLVCSVAEDEKAVTYDVADTGLYARLAWGCAPAYEEPIPGLRDREMGPIAVLPGHGYFEAA